MKNWHPNARVYEINTWVWLNTLSQRYGKTITLETIPDEIIAELASYHVDVIWMMGVWYHSKAVRDSALNYVHEYRGALPDITDDDVKGSAYAIGKYDVDARIGGRAGLEHFRERLQAHGLKLILDFVPNHVSTDHPIIATHPEYFVQGTEEMIAHEPGNFFRTKNAQGDDMIIAHGRDPYFSGWIDTAQFNAFNQGYRDAAVEVLLKIAALSDGVRCDMAMLMLNSIFDRTWGWTELESPDEDFWLYVIPEVLEQYPNFVFIAETYWHMDYQLQQQGFDFTYDKVGYDRLLDGNINGLYDHLNADINFVRRNIRFIENHDEQ
ncbi:MAG: alpha-amylase family glycosyl hydrolase, partial [Aggregatilineales bacterium]